jgi:hypothetical protein
MASNSRYSIYKVAPGACRLGALSSSSSQLAVILAAALSPAVIGLIARFGEARQLRLSCSCSEQFADSVGLLTLYMRGAIPCLALISGVLLLEAVRRLLRATRVNRPIIVQSHQPEDTVESWLAALRSPEVHVRQAAASQLITKLSSADAEELRNLSFVGRRRLYGCLGHLDGNLVASTLQVIARAGDARAIKHIYHLAHSAPRYPEDERIRQAARECLGALQSQSQGEPCTLVRSASPPAHPNEHLLRAVTKPGAVNAHLLIRPV